MASRYIGQINAKYNDTDIIITPDRAAADQDGAPIVNTTGAQSISGAKTFTGSTTISGKLTASNNANVLQVADHGALTLGNDVLNSKDINTVAGSANDLVHRSGAETVTGAKTFAGDTTVTGSFVTSGNAEMAKLDIDTGTLTVGSGGTVEINGALTASNTANVITAKNLTVGPDGTIVIDGDVTLNIKSGSVTLAAGTFLKSTDGNVSIKGTGNYFQGAHHLSVLLTSDILTAKDIMESDGSANNLLHKNGGIESLLKWVQFYNIPCLHEKTFRSSESTGGQWVKCFSYPHDMAYKDGIIDVEVFTGHSTEGRGKTTLELLRRNHIPVCRVKDCCNSSFVVGRLPADSTEDGACIINDGTNDTFYFYTGNNRPGYRVTFATIINPWSWSQYNSEFNIGCCTRNAFDNENYITLYDEIIEALPTEYVSIGYPKVVTPKS